MHMIRKGNIQGANNGIIQAQNQFIAGLFGLAVLGIGFDLSTLPSFRWVTYFATELNYFVMNGHGDLLVRHWPRLLYARLHIQPAIVFYSNGTM